jgi:hypothetical protein
MQTTVTLDKKHFSAAAKKAQKLGTTTDAYIERLIDADTMSFAELMAPVGEAFRKSDVTEDELDATVASARRAIYATPKFFPATVFPSASVTACETALVRCIPVGGTARTAYVPAARLN